MSDMTTQAIRRLSRRGAALTRQLARTDDLARERAAVWREALTLGASQQQLADDAGVHHAQIGKALRRYESTFPLPTRQRKAS